ncbi:Eco57I restriction-modification methylase domain-containing protein [Streptomyces halstedii]|uniref:Eco57I restriction-modification methylase domain-containing protein n=1 Tax=Streptomyces halstedii TaxID=1944 RepID=UPI0036A912B5
MTYDSLVNHGDYLSPHYLAEVLPKDLKAKDGILTRWAAFEETERRRHTDAVAEAAREGLDADSVPPRVRTPREGLRALHGPYFSGRAALAQDAAALAEPEALAPEGWRKRYTESHLDTLRAFGYTDAHEQTVTVHRADRAYDVQVLHAEPGLYAVACGWTTESDAALDPDGAGRLLHPVGAETSAPDLTDAKALTDFLFTCDAPPRHVLLLVGGVLVLADRLTWPEGRYLAADLDAALHRRDDRHGGELDTLAALFGADSLRVPTEGGTAPLAAFLDRSGKHAVGVSTELREGLRLSVEWIANEVLDRLREPENGVAPAELDDPARLAKELSRESLRYLYRILFLLYAEASPALGILPSDYPEYEQGYGLQRLGDLVLRDLVGERSRRGFHLYESLDLLFEKVENGHRRYGTEPEDLAAEAAAREATEAENEAAGLLAAGTITQAEYTERVREADRARRAAARSTSVGLRFEALRSELFTKEAVRLISDDQIENPAYEGGEGGGGAGENRRPVLDTRLRNETLHKVLRRLMLTKGRGRERGGFISYAQLGINQLGAVYEGLMSYTGFIAEEELYEVAKGGDPSGGSWMVPASRAQDYDDGVFVKRTNEETGRQERVAHPRGSFVYRLAGRDRQTSASYYTPKSLTEVTVELALRHRLDQNGTTTPAKELLEWKICEPALGSGAFLNEAIDQVAAEYLRRRERELGRRVDPELRQIELQKTKAYVALHNAYGVDLNATAVELAEVSLWLNSMHPGMRAPWFGLHLRRGNSLIGAGRKVYKADTLTGGGWLAKKNTLPPTDLPFREGPLPEGAVHQFLLPAIGWGAVAGEPEAKKLAEEEAKALGRWRKGVQKAPKGPKPFQERGDETDEARQKRYDRWRRAADKTELGRLQGVARRAEFLWSLVATRLELSERAVSRRVDVWGADWLEQPTEAEDKQKVLDDLTRHGTPYWRLKTVMDAWCALWFWPLDRTGELDGSDPVYGTGGALVDGASVPGLLGGTSEAAASVEPVEPASSSAPGDQLWSTAGLFDDPDGEQAELGEGLASSSGAARRSAPAARKTVSRPPERKTVPLQSFGDWLDFLESVLGTSDMPEQSLLSGIENLSPDDALELLADVEDRLEGFLGMRPAGLLPFRYPWLNTVEDIAGTTEKDIKAEDGHGFFHWELHFAHVFRGAAGGFDLQVGNPPWVRPEWLENQVLAEHEPWFMLTEKPTKVERTRRRDELLISPRVRAYLLAELASTSGMSEMLGSGPVYPLLAGTQPDLYRAFMCQTWQHTASDGSVGLVHPDSHFSGDREGRLREAAYTRLRVHGDFVNAGNRFFPPPVGRSSHFGVHIYGQAAEIGFDHLSWLFSVDALRLSADDDGTAPDPGVRYGESWDERPHRKRVVHVDEKMLARWQKLTGDETQAVRQARLLSPVSTAEAQAIEALADYSLRLAEYEPQISSGYHESGAKAADLIDYNAPDGSGVVRRPTGWSEVILKGPQIGLANPMFKQPSQGGGEVLGLNPMNLADDAVPESAYVYVAKPEVYRAAQDVWSDGRTLDQLKASEREVTRARIAVAGRFGVELSDVTEEQVEVELLRRLRRPYTEFYRVAWRKMIAPDTERALYTALLPSGASHVDALRSAALPDNRHTAMVAGFWASMPVDYLLRTARVRNLDVAPARRLPAPTADHPLASALLLRTLRLNCLTSAYADLWAELYEPTWPGYEPWAVDWADMQPLHAIRPTWERATPLRTERSRRAALVEIDALVAVWLAVSADALAAMYKSRFPIMQDFDAVTWFDANERKIAGDRYTYGFGQTKEHYEHFLAYQKKERPEPPEGYTAPFYKANREEEMREAHAHFSARLQEAIDQGKWTSPTS